MKRFFIKYKNTVISTNHNVMLEDSRHDISQNLHQTQPLMKSLKKWKRLLFYVCNYGNFSDTSIVEGTAFLLIEIFWVAIWQLPRFAWSHTCVLDKKQGGNRHSFNDKQSVLWLVTKFTLHISLRFISLHQRTSFFGEIVLKVCSK